MTTLNSYREWAAETTTFNGSVVELWWIMSQFGAGCPGQVSQKQSVTNQLNKMVYVVLLLFPWIALDFPIYIHSERIVSVSAIQAEDTTILQGLRIAATRGDRKITVEGDNLAVINAVKGIWSTLLTITNTIQDIKSCFQEFDYITFNHCRRSANRVANVS